MLQLGEYVAGLHLVALLDRDVGDAAGDLRADGGLPSRLEVARGRELRPRLAERHDADRLDLDHRKRKKAVLQGPVSRRSASADCKHEQQQPEQLGERRGRAALAAVDLEGGELAAQRTPLGWGRSGSGAFEGRHRRSRGGEDVVGDRGRGVPDCLLCHSRGLPETPNWPAFRRSPSPSLTSFHLCAGGIEPSRTRSHCGSCGVTAPSSARPTPAAPSRNPGSSVHSPLSPW